MIFGSDRTVTSVYHPRCIEHVVGLAWKDFARTLVATELPPASGRQGMNRPEKKLYNPSRPLFALFAAAAITMSLSRLKTRLLRCSWTITRVDV